MLSLGEFIEPMNKKQGSDSNEIERYFILSPYEWSQSRTQDSDCPKWQGKKVSWTF